MGCAPSGSSISSIIRITSLTKVCTTNSRLLTSIEHNSDSSDCSLSLFFSLSQAPALAPASAPLLGPSPTPSIPSNCRSTRSYTPFTSWSSSVGSTSPPTAIIHHPSRSPSGRARAHCVMCTTPRSTSSLNSAMHIDSCTFLPMMHSYCRRRSTACWHCASGGGRVGCGRGEGVCVCGVVEGSAGTSTFIVSLRADRVPAHLRLPCACSRLY